MQAIIGKEFPQKVSALIDAAQHSIKIVVFDWRVYPNDSASSVSLFNHAIVRAARRGVKIQAIVNHGDILNFLRTNNIDAKKLSSKNLVHTKMIILDDVNIVIGSHNFTQYAFTMNFEASAYIDACPDIASFLTFFNGLWVHG